MGLSERTRGHTPFFKMDMTLLLTLILAVITFTTPVSSSEPRVVCYYTNWSVYRPGTARFNPQNINPYLCTHLIYAFGGFTKDNTLKPFDKYQDIEKGGYAKFTGLKTYNKNLKTLLAIGGWNEGSTRFSPMVGSRERRKEFVRNAIKFLRQNRFDGLDLDWEYPAFREGGKPKDRENYSKLVKELREEFEREAEKTGRPRLLLTMAVPAGIEYIEKGFDVKTLNQYLDWMNLLTYDYHSAFEPAVNHHAPLYPLEEPNEYSVDTELNIDYTIKFYLESGADRDKLVLGIPTYGRSYTLFNADAVEIGSPADGPGEQGEATREKGYLAYYEICEALKPKDKKRKTDDSEEYSDEEEDEEWTVMHPNPDAMGPVAYKGNQWVGYDDIEIVKKKAQYVAENGLGGIMFWSIDNDDFRGTCHDKPYPLIESAKEAYLARFGSTDVSVSTERSRPAGRGSSKRRNRPKSTTTTTEPTTAKSNKRKSSSSTTPAWNITPEPPTTPDPGADFKCKDEGFFPHPRDCKKYFWCLDSGPSNLGIVAHQFTCPSGLFFNKAADSCDFARNVLCKMPAATTKGTTERPPTTKASTTVSTTTTTRKPIRLSTKNSLQFRTTTTTTTTPEPESEEYEDDVREETFEEDAEDPRVIKELIDLIKKVGGVEQLEKQLHLAEQSSSTTGGSTTTPTPFNKKLYQKVLERARGKNKYTGKSIINTQSTQQENSPPLNSRRGPQNQGLEPASDKDVLLKKERPQYTTINRQRSSTPAPEESEEESDSSSEAPAPAPALSSRGRAVEETGSSPRPLQYVNIRRAKPTDTADDTASRNALFERAESYVSVSEPNSLDIVSARRENIPEYVTIRRQRPTTEETTTQQYQETEPEVEPETELKATALEKEISSQPQYTSIVRTRATTIPPSPEPTTTEPIVRTRPTTLAPEEPSTPEPTTVLAVQISSLLNSPSSEEDISDDTKSPQSTEAEPTTTTTTTTTTAAPPRRTVLRRRGSSTTTPAPSSTTQVPRRTFPRRTKPPTPSSSPSPTPDTLEVETSTIDTETTTKFRRGGSKFKSRKEVESARNETRLENRGKRPSLNTAVKRNERPATRNFARRRPAGGNGTTTVTPSSPPSVTRRPFRIASRRRPSSTTTAAPTTTGSVQTTTAEPESEEFLQDIGDIDAIEDPTLEPRSSTVKVPKIQRRPLVNLKDGLKDQNPSATNEEETKRQSKKYSASFKQNQLDGLIRKNEDFTTESTSTIEDYNAETALAIATHQLITAPLPITTDYDEETLRAKTTADYSTYTERTVEYTDTYKVNPTQDFIQTTIDGSYDTTKQTIEDTNPTDFTLNTARPYGFTSRTQDIDAGKIAKVTYYPTTRNIGYTNTPTDLTITPTFETHKRTTLDRYQTNQVFSTSNGYTQSTGYTPQSTGYTPQSTGSIQSTGYNRQSTRVTPQSAGYVPQTTGYIPQTTGYTSQNVGYTYQNADSTQSLTSSYTSSPLADITSYPIVQRGNAKYATASGDSYSRYNQVQPTPDTPEPSLFTRAYLLASPKTDEENQYLSSTTPQTPVRKVFRKKIQRRISTTARPTTQVYVSVTTPASPAPTPRGVARKPFEKVIKTEPNRTNKPLTFDYYDDNSEKVALKYAEETKVILHGKGSIECLDVGNFPHPSSCKKFISCARMEFGSLLGWEYVCPKGLSFDPVGGICNWSAGLGCDEKDI